MCSTVSSFRAYKTMIYSTVRFELAVVNCVCTTEEGFRAKTYCTVYHRFVCYVYGLKEDTVEYMMRSNEPDFYYSLTLLQDVNARTSPPKDNTPLRAFSIAGSAISMVGLIISIITLLAFK